MRVRELRILPFFLLLFIAVFGGCAGKEIRPTPSREGSTAPLVGTFEVRSYKLDNGLRLLVVEDHSSPTFAYQTWFRVGSRDELPGKTGLAHLFEHLMFKQTKNLPDGQFDRLLEEAGAEGENAFTDHDVTAYIQELPSERLELIVRLEADRMVNLVVNDETFKTEREVVQNERRQRNENSPDGLLRQELFALAFRKHPYRWPIAGYAADLERLTASDARDFYQSYYSPNHATIIVAGDVNPERVLTTVQKYYGEIPAQAAPVQTLEEEPPQTAPRSKRLKLNLQVEKLLMSWHVPELGNRDMPALQLLQTLLCGGKSARLPRALVDGGLASDVSCYFADTKDPSLWIIESNLLEKKKAVAAEAVILRTIGELLSRPIDQAELDRAKSRLSFEFFEGLSGNMDKAGFLGRYETLTGNFQTGIDQHRRATELSAPELQLVVKRYLHPDSRTTLIGVPR